MNIYLLVLPEDGLLWYIGRGHQPSLPHPLPGRRWCCRLLQCLLHPGSFSPSCFSFSFRLLYLEICILVLLVTILTYFLRSWQRWCVPVATLCRCLWIIPYIWDWPSSLMVLLCTFWIFQFSGICGSLLLGTGFVGAILTGILVDRFSIFPQKPPSPSWLDRTQIQIYAFRFGRMEEVAKLFYGISGIFGILIAEFMRFGDIVFYYPFLKSVRLASDWLIF